jgi:hypothetical protein
MKISASRSTRRLTLSACALAVLTASVPAAEAKPAAAELRVQGDQRALASGQTYLTDTARITTATRKPACGGSGETKTVKGPSALSLLIDAAGVSRTLRPLGISDKFDFGLLVCSIGRSVSSDSAFWLYKVNHAAPEVGADQRRIRPGDEVLWYFSNTKTGRNTGDELALDAPARSTSSDSFEVKVTAYDFAGKRTPAAGAIVRYGRKTVTADENGLARVTTEDGPRMRLRAVRGTDVASEIAEVCVADRLRDCPAVALRRSNGTTGADRFRGSRGPEVIRSYGGRDRIGVRGGGRDVVFCGRGVDRILVDANDRAARDCEFVNGRRRASRSARRR